MIIMSDRFSPTRPTLRKSLPASVAGAALLLLFSGTAQAQIFDLTGVWTANDGGTYRSLVQLYRALGGGWQQ
jgi:hypothetical protein